MLTGLCSSPNGEEKCERGISEDLERTAGIEFQRVRYFTVQCLHYSRRGKIRVRRDAVVFELIGVLEIVGQRGE